MLGFLFIQNFDAPYWAESITDFWRRWHISLSTWLRDYLYIPLGGNRRGTFRTYANLMVVMLLGGLWHGASWTFVIWGAIHGGMLVVERLQGKTSAYRRWPRPLRTGITFAIVCIAWVFFRADTMGRAMEYLSSLFGIRHVSSASELAAGVMYTPYHVVMFLIAVLLVWRAPQSWAFTRNLTLGRAVACLLFFAVSVLLMWTQTENPFLYFQF
jgi:alginate O-acetyltransferase complex protein AlgI